MKVIFNSKFKNLCTYIIQTNIYIYIFSTHHPGTTSIEIIGAFAVEAFLLWKKWHGLVTIYLSSHSLPNVSRISEISPLIYFCVQSTGCLLMIVFINFVSFGSLILRCDYKDGTIATTVLPAS